MFALEGHSIFLTVAGSHAHGTSRPGSDVDLRGVCVAPLGVRLSLFHHFEQYEGELPEGLAARVRPGLERHPTAARGLEVKTECVIFDVAKFLGLCAAANPNALEILFADPADWVLATPAWRRLHDARQQFLTKKVRQTFGGYAMAQLKRIETHRSWLLEPPAKKPSREDFGLPSAGGTLGADDRHRIEQSIASRLRSYGIDDLDMPKSTRVALVERLRALQRDLLGASEEEFDARLRAVATRGLQLPVEIVSALNAEKKYRAALKRWESYQTWKTRRNPARAQLERQHGYDTKHAMHLVRLMRMGIEALESGELRVRRDDADELVAIRDGAVSFEELLRSVTTLQEAMESAAARTRLPADVDPEAVDALLLSLVGEP